jgi:DNA-binding CsgD family transcriptional regulator
VTSAQGQPERAARLYGAAEALREASGAALSTEERAERDRDVARARGGVERAAFEAARAAGKAMSLEQAVIFALADAQPIPLPVAAGGGRIPAAVATPVTTAGVAHDEQVPLTRREREVAVLISRGLTNKQIGEVLVIAEGTVNIHVGNILGKLGFSSRSQVAAWVARTGIDTDQAR